MSAPHWRWPTDFPFRFLAEPFHPAFPGALTDCFADLLISSECNRGEHGLIYAVGSPPELCSGRIDRMPPKASVVMTPHCPMCCAPMKQDNRAFRCEPCRQIIIFFAVSETSPYVAALGPAVARTKNPSLKAGARDAVAYIRPRRSQSANTDFVSKL